MKSISFKIIIAIALTSSFSINSLGQNVRYSSGNLILENNQRISQEFTIILNDGETIKDGIILSSGDYTRIPYDDLKKLYGGIEIKYMYTKKALRNDLDILDSNIEYRKRTKFWDDIFKALLVGADEYFTNGALSKLKSTIELAMNSDSEEYRRKYALELAANLAKDEIKKNMTKEEKAIAESFLSVLQSNLTEDKVIISYKVKKELIRKYQPTAKTSFEIINNLVKRTPKSYFSSSGSTFLNIPQIEQSVTFLNSENYLFQNKIPFDFRLKYNLYSAETFSSATISYGFTIGYTHFPQFEIEQESISIESPNAGAFAKMKFGKKIGFAIGLNYILYYNDINELATNSDRVEELSAGIEYEGTISFSGLDVIMGYHQNSFNPELEGHRFVLAYLGVEIPIKRNYSYTEH